MEILLASGTLQMQRPEMIMAIVMLAGKGIYDCRHIQAAHMATRLPTNVSWARRVALIGEVLLGDQPRAARI
ncbi:hypothetical protein ACFQPC_00915 [Herminiimonas glaciei]|uniref:Uncharacterized protein n=1 Tax=Herminiimonas glaciei TaxID=523788 RepID=A0ABW2I6F1_9BURK